MKFRLFRRPHLLLALCFLAGLLQYLPLALSGGKSEVTLWQFDEADLAEAGPFRYIKDAFVFGIFIFSAASVTYFSRAGSSIAKSVRKWWVLWLLLLVLGALPYLVGATPYLLLTAGIRWMLLLVFAQYVWLVCYTMPMTAKQEFGLWAFLLMAASVDSVFMIRQIGSVAGIYGIGLGAARLTGVFGSAGAAGFFSLACALIAATLKSVRPLQVIVLLSVAFFGALGSGTRFVMIGIFVVAVIYVRQELRSTGRAKLAQALVPVTAALAIGLYGAMISIVDRGGIFEAGASSGGRLSNAALSIDRILSSDVLEVFFGRGIGVGTNTGETLLVQNYISPETVRYHWLVDNAFLTFFFQFGLLGSVLFWGAVSLFMRRLVKLSSPIQREMTWGICIVVILTCFAGSPFEHYFLMLGFAAGLGRAARPNKRRLEIACLSPGRGLPPKMRPDRGPSCSNPS